MTNNNKTYTIFCGKSFMDAIEKLTPRQKEEIYKAYKRVPIKVDSKTFHLDRNILDGFKQLRK